VILVEERWTFAAVGMRNAAGLTYDRHDDRQQQN
jgi:hypothetical protein